MRFFRYIKEDIEKKYKYLGKEFINEFITKKDGKWCVISHKDKDPQKTFGCYDTEKEAKDRLKQIQYFAHQNESSFTSDYYNTINQRDSK